MRCKLILILLCTTVKLFAQEHRLHHKNGNAILFGPSLGYQYQGKNFIKVGAFGLTTINNNQYLKINVGANFTQINEKTATIPELGVTYYFTESNFSPYTKVEVTPYTITPTVGLSYYIFVDVGVGYGANYSNKDRFKAIKGFTINAGVNIPLNFNVY